jgi:hypothetical protein
MNPEVSVVEYRLTEADVRHYATAGRARACRRLGREQGWGLLPLIAVGLLLFGLCYQSHGIRAVGLAVGTTLAVLLACARLREAGTCRRACRLARDLGVPLDLRLTASALGLVKDPAPDGSDPGRRFGWSEVVEVDRVDHLTVIRLRPAGGVLLIPDRAFPDPEARGQFAARARHWRDSAQPVPG